MACKTCVRSHFVDVCDTPFPYWTYLSRIPLLTVSLCSQLNGLYPMFITARPSTFAAFIILIDVSVLIR